MYRTERFKGTDLGTAHHTYLLTICRNPGISQEQLARMIYINKSNVTRNLAVLEKNGYIERRPSETDKRVTLVYPTPLLEELLPKVREINREWSDYILDGFTPEEIEQLEETMLKIARRAKEYVNSKDELDT